MSDEPANTNDFEDPQDGPSGALYRIQLAEMVNDEEDGHFNKAFNVIVGINLLCKAQRLIPVFQVGGRSTDSTELLKYSQERLMLPFTFDALSEAIRKAIDILPLPSLSAVAKKISQTKSYLTSKVIQGIFNSSGIGSRTIEDTDLDNLRSIDTFRDKLSLLESIEIILSYDPTREYDIEEIIGSFTTLLQLEGVMAFTITDLGPDQVATSLPFMTSQKRQMKKSAERLVIQVTLAPPKDDLLEN